MRRLALAFYFIAISTSAHGSCLDEMAKFAERICGEISTKGSSSVVDAGGGLNAEAKGLLKKFVGSAGVGGDVEVVKESYENVLREHLESELRNNRDCRIKMVAVGQKYCTEAVGKSRLELIRWPEGHRRYYIEAANIRPSCPEDAKKTNHELEIDIADTVVTVELDGNRLRGRLIDEGKTILVSGRIPSEGGYTSFSNGELRLRSDKKIEAELEWIWRDSDGNVCTGALLVSDTVEQRGN